jgi:hypothetical protein
MGHLSSLIHYSATFNPYTLGRFFVPALLLLVTIAGASWIIQMLYQLYALHRFVETATIRLLLPPHDDISTQSMEQWWHVVIELLHSQTSRQRTPLTLELYATRLMGVSLYLSADPALIEPLSRAIASVLPRARVEQVARPAFRPDLLQRLTFRYPGYFPLRVTEATPAAGYLGASLSRMTEDDAACIQLLISPVGFWQRWRLPRTIAPTHPYHNEIIDKLSHTLVTAAIRVGVSSGNRRGSRSRLREIVASLKMLNYPRVQELVDRPSFTFGLERLAFTRRRLWPSSPLLLSTHELAQLFHPSSMGIGLTEDVAHNRNLLVPSPLIMKRQRGVVIGQSITTPSQDIVLTPEDRSRHVYILGQTGSGKSTILYHMAASDIAAGNGVAVIDPHGDLIDDLLSSIVSRSSTSTQPVDLNHRIILIDPSDLRYPVGINLLEVSSDLTDPDEILAEREMVCEGVISVFKRVFGQEEDTNAHRIEYILRNVIHTAFVVEGATIFTLYQLLNDTPYRKRVLPLLTDPNLLLFWKNEFSKSGDWQQVKMVSGVTAKIGRFLFSPTVKRILEQPRSTIDFDLILREGKVLLCNLSEGKMGEDNSHLMGSVIITKLHLAALRRARLARSERLPFNLYVDEFQHFATSYFTRLLSGGRKFGLRLTLAQQSTAQIKDQHMLQVILANTGTVIAFRTASTFDAQLLLPLFQPLVTHEDLVNLPRHNFYIKLGATDPEQAFSGRTISIPAQVLGDQVELIREASRRHFAKAYVSPTPVLNVPMPAIPDASLSTNKVVEDTTMGTLSD